MCGAACLVMVFRSFNITCSQSDLWGKIKFPDGKGGFYGKSHKLCLVSFQNNLYSLCLRVKDPIKTLKLCHEYSLRVILGHRPNESSMEGHFTTFTKIQGDSVYVNDPELGASGGRGKELKSSEILKLMDGSGNELPKNLLLIISDQSFDNFQCLTCSIPVASSINCPQCSNQIVLQPAKVFGCLVPTCPSSMVEELVCPYCDNRLSFRIA